MKNTKEKILQASLLLFNEKGMVNVSLRQIAQELNISQGNLNYHFKLKEDIVEALYFQLVEEMDNQMKSMELDNQLESLYKSSIKTMEKMYDYKFILIDFIHLMNENKKIKSHYAALMKFRNEQFQSVFRMLIEAEIFRPAEFEQEYERLYQRMNIIGDSWINVYATFDEDNSVEYYGDLLFEMIYPYLTDKGKREYWGFMERS
ncbi:TetR family transcriptional regulator [Marivirga tractuosa]|uniref:Regulatory protein TetR n=1 Tax=Marivirga tractuosa (strain ATCC 23168 / DSM 4126 / NBRC 15989 / NCIMB 1408 / VKM B-1430 / H-43) TaxID=643867 RepID=E4TTI5_MARTH|nr:TetR/AcrR family transcriptional regulator [Marivirga tractuosa]ADR22988.1 regulatory protein TetR [Marivirga tractuosa DSM 4126]BDD16338.1 TetR family transcriptional regulator [Marivirga tractuosa]